MMNDTDIMLLPHYSSAKRRHMTLAERAAQFAAFAALTGFDEEIGETARLTDPFAEMSEDGLADLNAAMQRLLNEEAEQPQVTVMYFQADAKKEGGAHLSYTGKFRHYDAAESVLIFTDKTQIPAQNICRIIFSETESR